MRAAIRVERLAKRYRLGELGHHSTLGDSLAALLRRWRANGKAAGGADEIWALKDVSFEVQPGEVVGIIGRNGAGKSTLLKVLSRITEPTEGAVELRGRVSSLLEVGTGFHPELTGRENVYLNGSILGMRKAEINRKFDAIVDFAGVERFLDTPVKRYSSGMQVRLAFAVAAHLEPEILIIDEVLAVGDAEFQRKCLGKMGEVAGDGRTVLFVSHNMAAVERLCPRAILLSDGQLAATGPSAEVIAQHIAQIGGKQPCRKQFESSRDAPAITSLAVDPHELARGNLAVDIGFRSPRVLKTPIGGILVLSSSGVPVYGTNTRIHDEGYRAVPASEGTIRVLATKLPIYPGAYYLSAWLADWEENLDAKEYAVSFDYPELHGASMRQLPRSQGSLSWPAQWSIVEAR